MANNKKGIAFILLATLSFSIMNLIAKELSEFHPMQVVFFRSFGTFILIFPYMLFYNVPILGTQKTLLILRSLIGMISLSCFFFAIQRIPLGSAISIRYLGPFFGAALAVYYLKERVNIKQWLSFAIAFFGVLILKGFDWRIDNLSFALLIVSAIFVGGVFVLVRFLSTKEHYLTIINYFMVFGMLGGLMFVRQWTWPETDRYLFIALLGITGMIGQIFMTLAFKESEATVLAPFKYMELIYAMVLAFIFYGETYTFLPLIGIVLIMVGMLLNVVFKKAV